MSTLKTLKREAVRRGLVSSGAEIDAEIAFELVRDMHYQRASDRNPETLINEWRGTCSGKHYLLKQIFSELGYTARIIACSSESIIDPDKVPVGLHELWERVGRRLVDVHNYLELETGEGRMIVDATWPIDYQKYGLKVNKQFKLGQDQEIACNPLQIWVVAEEVEPQAFKEQLLTSLFTPDELAFRDAYITALGVWFEQEGIKGG